VPVLPPLHPGFVPIFCWFTPVMISSAVVADTRPSSHLVVIGMGHVGIPCDALFADVPTFRVAGVQRRSRWSD